MVSYEFRFFRFVRAVVQSDFRYVHPSIEGTSSFSCGLYSSNEFCRWIISRHEILKRLNQQTWNRHSFWPILLRHILPTRTHKSIFKFHSEKRFEHSPNKKYRFSFRSKMSPKIPHARAFVRQLQYFIDLIARIGKWQSNIYMG